MLDNCNQVGQQPSAPEQPTNQVTTRQSAQGQKNQQNTVHMQSGFCFKCGSTEHSHKECKELEYKLANCFYCGKKGHIARECEQNEKGLYRKGGSCFGCGSVRHTLKDCPTRHKQGQAYHNKEQY